ncbi:MAG TPA: mechanosensitive ion channel domain-containing protein [Verrucomicrobiae bacterium]|nr:mechanosensitive ion channel domain-containing protein [Verrucomicrobiae bacterium]
MERLIDILPANFPNLAGVWAVKILLSVVIFLAFLLLSTVLKKIICRLGRSADPDKEAVLNLLGGITRTSLLIFGAITAMGTLGINVSALVAGLGLTGFALGFAFRDALANILAGIMILLYHPFRLGDRVMITGLEGSVVGIDLRYTTLQNEAKTFLIPNSVLLTNAIVVNRV